MLGEGLLRYVVIALAVLLLVTTGGSWYFYNKFQVEIQIVSTLKAQIDELGRNQKQKDEDIQLCNSRVDALVKFSQQVKDKGVQEQKRASIESKKNNDKAVQLLLDKIRDNENSCQAAKRLLDNYLDGRKSNETIPSPTN